MARRQGSVTEALVQAHRAILADLRELEQAVGSVSGDALAELRARLAATDAHVSEHFQYEERNGYLDVVEKREPRLERDIHRLAEEHRELRRSLEALITETAAATSLADPLREAVRKWIESMRRHERHENDLVQDAFNLDIGAED